MTEITMPDDGIRAELATLRAELTAAISAGLAAVQQAVASLTEAHHKSLLDQAKLNASFADRERVEALAGRVQDHANSLIAHEHRLTVVETTASDFRREVSDGLRSVNSQLTDVGHQLKDIRASQLTPDQRGWVQKGEERARQHADVRTQLGRNLLTYVAMAVTGAFLAAVGIGPQLGQLLSHLFGRH